ncbi:MULTISPECIES: sigS mRNA-stabilizing protein SroA [Staphylococcus]|uniref:DUF1659 domain-containing protein n=1 Tax=Staphylococcus hsinchuensis TaxID=3051183 RepID=A0ABZ3EEX6_9STAP|nr:MULTISPECIES: DUF1659 domain-containing protein [unclassified Staphylococcus]
MNNINKLEVTMSRNTNDKDGKPVTYKRHFSNLNTSATHDQLKSFQAIIEKLTGERFEKLEVITTEQIK